MAYNKYNLPDGDNRILHTHATAELFEGYLAPGSPIQDRLLEQGKPFMTVHDIEATMMDMPSICGWSPSVFPGYTDCAHPVVGYWRPDDSLEWNLRPSNPTRNCASSSPQAPHWLGVNGSRHTEHERPRRRDCDAHEDPRRRARRRVGPPRRRQAAGRPRRPDRVRQELLSLHRPAASRTPGS
eukprot:256515-Prymnesium_polylepis.2